MSVCVCVCVCMSMSVCVCVCVRVCMRMRACGVEGGLEKERIKAFVIGTHCCAPIWYESSRNRPSGGMKETTRSTCTKGNIIYIAQWGTYYGLTSRLLSKYKDESWHYPTGEGSQKKASNPAFPITLSYTQSKRTNKKKNKKKHWYYHPGSQLKWPTYPSLYLSNHSSALWRTVDQPSKYSETEYTHKTTQLTDLSMIASTSSIKSRKIIMQQLLNYSIFTKVRTIVN